MPLADPISLIGGALFIIAYGGLNFGLFKEGASSTVYQLLNTIGAACFTYTAIKPFNPGLFITEAVWALFGIYGVIKIYTGVSKKKAAAN
ncbi:putative permease [Corynebacterium renale]|uniref:CBU-0592-like domain-containing protein n=1 Tax=Corynebacterium renale TaxID=1724 RepID=A0A2A9DSL6_9CORY|nr:hypothetical protein [Corynebacterium renale]PFG28930.1 hypothetical protein ATK06_2059 [Corynebacterium renale]SQG64476.1 putative permease [Corynebacterium renale]SQI25551.1 putative permease [Corynebacterium renale]STC95375.1 putative permease [Corynebacterium renale]